MLQSVVVELEPEKNGNPTSIEPRATYRVQLHAGFTLDDAADLLDYLAEMGISHLYCAPILQAVPGSTHGYDTVNPHRVNEDLGGEPALRRLVVALEQRRMGAVLDIVPNHMAIDAAHNPWWWDVLENGPSSPYASYFDVDWNLPDTEHGNAVLLPILGDHYGRVLEAGEITLEFQCFRQDGSATEVENDLHLPVLHPLRIHAGPGQARGCFLIHVYDHVLPVDPRSIGDLLAAAADCCGSDALAFLGGAFVHLPRATATDRASAQRRNRDQEVLYGLLGRLYQEQPQVKRAIQQVVKETNADLDALEALLGTQNYRLAFWRLSERELGYRRFFNINSLIGLHMEDPEVFRHTHFRILGWLREGWLHGLRIDHPDGLWNPEQYLRWLRQSQPEAWTVVEKILEEGEVLRPTWPVAGTTGYDFINRANGLFVDPAGEQPLTAFYARFTGISAGYAAIAREKKLLVMYRVLGSDANYLTTLFRQICQRHRRMRDYTHPMLRQALCEVAASLPVYRTYVVARAGSAETQVHPDDVRYIDRAVAEARARSPDLDDELFAFLRDLLLLRIPGKLENELAMRFQQFTGPAMAKGVEDTAFYVYNRLVALNEVGGDPGRFGFPVEAFHRSCLETQERWPRTMLASSTHDTKRSEDVRARLDVLSEIPAQWIEAVQRWSTHNERYRRHDQPDRNDEYLIYQTLVGAWPIEQERLLEYMQKACREAKVHTTWDDPNPEYETAVAGFVRAILADPDFTSDLEGLASSLVEPGRVNGLAQTLLKLTAPGVPDFYQGTELWNLTLVDPDNRRPVDYGQRRQLLAELDGLTPEEILARADEGLPKLWVIRQALAVRRRHPSWFGPQSAYQPLPVTSDHSRKCALAFARSSRLVTVVPRLRVRAGNAWQAAMVEVPPGTWRNVLTGERVAAGLLTLGSLLARFPVCLLVREDAPDLAPI